MRKEQKIINTNIRLNLCGEQDRKASSNDAGYVWGLPESE